MCMRKDCGGGKKSKPQVGSKPSSSSQMASKSSVRKTNWATGVGQPKVKFNFAGSRGR